MVDRTNQSSTETTRRAILIVFTIVLVGPPLLIVVAGLAVYALGPGYKWKAQSFFNQIQKSTTTETLQDWAVAQIAEADGQRVEMDDVPPFIVAANDGPPKYVYVASTEYSAEPHIHAIWGGGFGHWGLKIGSPTFRAVDDARNYHIEWKPGVYVWHEIQ